MITTNESLLGRLRADNAQHAWQEFFDAYWGAILRYARKLGLDQSQAEEVLQETMVALMRLLPAFVYDRRKGRFRNFLLAIVHRKSLATLQRAARNREVRWHEAIEATPLAATGADTGTDGEARSRWRDSLLEEALRRLRDAPRLGENSFEVFEAYVLQGEDAAQVARRFGLTENAVYQVRNRFMRRLRLEVARLMKSSGTE